MHWGIHFVPATIADYQREVVHAAIDAGADLILGHHPHILKGIEVYGGRAIFYSLGNFAMDLPMTAGHAARPGFLAIQALHPGWEVDLDSTDSFAEVCEYVVAVGADQGLHTELALRGDIVDLPQAADLIAGTVT